MLGINDLGQVSWRQSGSATIRNLDGTLQQITLAPNVTVTTAFNIHGEALATDTEGRVYRIDSTGNSEVLLDLPDDWILTTSLNELGGVAIVARDLTTDEHYLYASVVAGVAPVEILRTGDLLGSHLVEGFGISADSYNDSSQLALAYFRHDDTNPALILRGVAQLHVVPEASSIVLSLAGFTAIAWGAIRRRLSNNQRASRDCWK